MVDTFSGAAPEYYRDIYGDGTITWVPPVNYYKYTENISLRGDNDTTFRWKEVEIDISTVQSGALLDFTMPDNYIVQITPNIGWHDSLAMFGEYKDTSLHNPHLVTLGPYSIENGTLTDNGDDSVTVNIDTGQFISTMIDGFPNYLWRAVPWGDGNPGLGGIPEQFEYISTIDQLKFTVDPVKKETKKNTQTIAGLKTARINVSIEEENNPTVFVEQTDNTWKVIFNIDRANVKFNIIATDIGGKKLTFYKVDISYDNVNQLYSHYWNPFDSFALLASIDRLPNETNESIKNRTLDAFVNKGGSHLEGLVNGINRELGLKQFKDAILLKRDIGPNGSPRETNVQIGISHTRIGVTADSFIIYDEILPINSYNHIVKTTKRILEIIKIVTFANTELYDTEWEIYSRDFIVDGNEILIDEKYEGLLKISYVYVEDIKFSEHSNLNSVVARLNSLTNPSDKNIFVALLNHRLSGSEKSKYLNKELFTLSVTNPAQFIQWSPIGLSSIANPEYKWSFTDEFNTFFSSKYYQYVLELKSRTNIEWGHIVADEDYWDAVDSNWYGLDSLPIIFDTPLADFKANASKTGSDSFDPWEAFRMSYYYNGSAIMNAGIPSSVFKSGVGANKDCATSVTVINISGDETKININPVVYKTEDQIDIDPDDIAGIRVII